MKNDNLKFKIKPADDRRYVLSDPQNLQILTKVYQLEGYKLSQEDKKLIQFV